MARVAEQTERYDEMVACMRRAVKLSPDLLPEERQLLAVAYKHVVTSRRASWRVAKSVEEAESEGAGSATATGAAAAQQLTLTKNYRKQIEAEVLEVCGDLHALLERYLLPAASSDEAKVFFLKLKGDYFRYCAEIVETDEEREKAHEAYTKASEIATNLRPLNPLRLGLALNFSVYYLEVLKSPDKACQLARQAFEEAINDDDDLDEEQRREAALIMQLLRDNLFLWTEEDAEERD